jgi:hypothetical protein
MMIHSTPYPMQLSDVQCVIDHLNAQKPAEARSCMGHCVQLRSAADCEKMYQIKPGQWLKDRWMQATLVVGAGSLENESTVRLWTYQDKDLGISYLDSIDNAQNLQEQGFTILDIHTSNPSD